MSARTAEGKMDIVNRNTAASTEYQIQFPIVPLFGTEVASSVKAV